MDTEGGIFQSSSSALVAGRGGECMTGTGGEPGPRGTFFTRNLGGSRGSTGASCILMMRWPAPELNSRDWLAGVYLGSQGKRVLSRTSFHRRGAPGTRGGASESSVERP